MEIIGDVDRRHLGEHYLGLLLVLRQDDLLHRSILIVSALLDLDLDRLHTLHLDHMIRVHHVLLFRDQDLPDVENDHRLGSSRPLAISLIVLAHLSPRVKTTDVVMTQPHQLSLHLVLVDIEMATTIDHLQVDHRADTAKRHKCHLQLVLRIHPCQCQPIAEPILQYFPLLPVHVVPPRVALMDPLEIFLLLRLDEAALEVHRQGRQVTI